jgi:uncharacterized membrane protein
MLNLSEKRWSVVLFASLALNMFLLGGIAVHMLGKRGHGPRRGGDFGAQHMPPRGFDGRDEMGGPGPEGPPELEGPAGMMSGPHGSGGPPGFGPAGPGGPGGPELLREVLRVMGGPRDPRVHELWQTRRAEQHRFHEQIQEARLAAQNAMASEPFDRAKLEAALAELQRIMSEGQRRAQSTAVDLVERLTPEERARLKP